MVYCAGKLIENLKLHYNQAIDRTFYGFILFYFILLDSPIIDRVTATA